MREDDFSLKVADCRFELGESSSSSTHPPRKRKGHVYPPPDKREKTQTRDKTQIQKTNIIRR